MNQNLGTLRAPQHSRVQIPLQFTVTKYIYLIVALDDSTESPTCCLLWQSVHFLALSKLQGKMCKWNTLQKVPVLITVLALLPIQFPQLMLWCLFPCGQLGFPLQTLQEGYVVKKYVTASRMSVLFLCSSTTSMWFHQFALKLSQFSATFAILSLALLELHLISHWSAFYCILVCFFPKQFSGLCSKCYLYLRNLQDI